MTVHKPSQLTRQLCFLVHAPSKLDSATWEGNRTNTLRAENKLCSGNSVAQEWDRKPCNKEDIMLAGRILKPVI